MTTPTTITTGSDPGPVPDILKRQPEPPKPEPPKPQPQVWQQPQAQTSVQGQPAVQGGVIHLATDVLVKTINDEYGVILTSERANLPRALAIAEKLNVLRARIRRGQWKTKFKSFGLKISYETASVYLRIWEHWPEIKELAAAKSVDPTLLTIDAPREHWARRNEDDDEEEDADTDAGGDEQTRGKPTAEAMEARQAANAEAEAKALEDEDVDLDAERRQRVDKTFEVLTRTYPQDELLDLTGRLAKHLGMTLTKPEVAKTSPPTPLKPPADGVRRM